MDIGTSYSSYQSDLLTGSVSESGYQKALSAARSQQKAEKAATSFEEYFASFMLREMRKTVQHSGLIPRTQAEGIFEEMMDQGIARKIAENKLMGISNMILEHMRVKH